MVLHTDRLTLILADPSSDADCQSIIRLYKDEKSGMGGNTEGGLNSIPDVRIKHKLHGPKPEFCTLAPPP